MTIEDWPELPYRGFMLDVVRDFRTVDEVLEILDLMASWKLNGVRQRFVCSNSYKSVQP
jgi:hexosaminidase